MLPRCASHAWIVVQLHIPAGIITGWSVGDLNVVVGEVWAGFPGYITKTWLQGQQAPPAKNIFQDLHAKRDTPASFIQRFDVLDSGTYRYIAVVAEVLPDSGKMMDDRYR